MHRIGRACAFVMPLVAAACAPDDGPVLRFGDPHDHRAELSPEATAGREAAVEAWRTNPGDATAATLVTALFPELAPRSGPASRAGAPLRVVPPGDGGAPLRLETRGLAFEVQGPGEGGPVRRAGLATFTGPRRFWAPAGAAMEDGNGWLADRVEDWEIVEGGGVYRASYRMRLPREIRGIRADPEYLEFFDGRDGPPVLRLHRPVARDAKGSTRTGTLALRGARTTDRPRELTVEGDSLGIEVELSLVGLAPPIAVDPAWSATGSLATERTGHTVTRLPDGKVLAVGGWTFAGATSSCELWDPATGTWAATGALGTPRWDHAATLLSDGRLLVTGGSASGALAPDPSAELFDPASGTWAPTGSLVVARRGHTASLLADGSVLVAAGSDGMGALRTTETWNPSTGAWTLAGDLAWARRGHRAGRLPDGRVIVTGGDAGGAPVAATELFAPATRTWASGAALAVGRTRHGQSILADGRVLVVGGRAETALTPTAEIRDPVTGTWSPTGSLALARERLATLVLEDGAVLAVGGATEGVGAATGAAELWEPATGTWLPVGALLAERIDPPAVQLSDGRVLFAGGGTGTAWTATEYFTPGVPGWLETGAMASPRSSVAAVPLPGGRVLAVGGSEVAPAAEIWSSATGRWTPTAAPLTPRTFGLTATALADGRVLLAGGSLGSPHPVVAAAELFDPATESWAATGSLGQARMLHRAVLLANGDVFVTGGSRPGSGPIPDETFGVIPGTWTTRTARPYRYGHGAVRLADGRVLVAGGLGDSMFATTELVDPVTGAVTASGSLAALRAFHTTTVLPDGRVLVAGGTDFFTTLATAEVWNPATGTWSPTGPLVHARQDHTATLLPNGLVLVAGGSNGPGALASAELFDPSTETWTETFPLRTPRAGHAAVPLPEGCVLVMGGMGPMGALASSELCCIPSATASNRTVPEDGSVPVGLAGTSRTRTPLSFRVIRPPVHGTLSGTGASLTYAPDADWSGADSLVFVANDGTVDSAPATVSITVTPVNDAPVAAAQARTAAEDGSVAVTLVARDVDGDALTYRVTVQPAHGTLSGTPPDLTYVPAANYHGPDAFSFVANDGTVDAAPATVSITVTPVNDAPVAAARAQTTAEDASVPVTLVATDADGDVLAYRVTVQPAHGTLTGTPPDLSYLPAANYHGPDAFSFVANDGTVDSEPAEVSLAVTPANDTPVAAAQARTVAEDGSVAVTLAGTDVDGDALTYRVTVQPAHGTLTGTPPDLTYTPAANHHGPDSFAFVANDGTVDSAPAPVSIIVTPLNDAPVAAAQAQTTAEDASVPVTLVAADVDGDALAFRVTVQPAHGTLTGAPPDLTYVPAANYHGPESFSFVANDGTVDSAPATVSITVAPVNDAPVALAQTLATDEDAEVTIVLAAADVDGEARTYRVTVEPAHGTILGTPPNLTYTPAANYHGPDSFTFVANDGTVDSPPAAVTIDVAPVNDPPAFVAPTPSGTLQALEGEAVAFTVAVEDADGDGVRLGVTPVPPGATFVPDTGAFAWVPAWTDAGTRELVLAASDGLVSVESTVAIAVTAIDLDADGLPDSWETSLGLDPATDDADGDGIADRDEVGPDLANPRDTDGDGTIDALDDDSDADGILDADEAGDDDPATPPVDTDGDGSPDYRADDSDGDGFPDRTDVCRTVPDPEQVDRDGDGRGNACDPDDDGDGIPDEDELRLGLDPLESDTDGDGIPDDVELGDLADPLDSDGDGVLDALDDDADGDGIPDAVEAGDDDPATPPVDTDGDEIPDYLDTDADDDGIEDGVDLCRLVADPSPSDLDGDGRGDACDDDEDGDRVPDELDVCPLVADAGQADSDGDGIGDACDEEANPVANPGEGDGGGCGCRSTATTDAAGLLTLGAVLAWLGRRRR